MPTKSIDASKAKSRSAAGQKNYRSGLAISRHHGPENISCGSYCNPHALQRISTYCFNMSGMAVQEEIGFFSRLQAE